MSEDSSEDSSQDHSMTWSSTHMLDNTIRDALLSDVFMNQNVNDTNLQDNGADFSTKTSKKKRKIGQVINNSTDNTNKRKLILIVKGKSENIAETNQLKLKKFFLGFDPEITANDIKLHKDYITVAVETEKQRDKIFTIQDILGKEIEVEEHKANKNILNSKVIIFGVPITWDETDITEETEAIEAYRLTKYNQETQTKESTTTVILTYNITNPPKQVFIGFKQFTVKAYVPKPQRCFNCQLFGHSSKSCRGKTTCARCAQNHKTEDCQLPKYQENSVNPQPYKCRNCNEQHPSGFRGCTAYVKAQTITEIKTTNRISYAEAVNKYKQTSQQKATTDSDNTLLKTSSTNNQQMQSARPRSTTQSINSPHHQLTNNTIPKKSAHTHINFLLPMTSTPGRSAPGRSVPTLEHLSKDACRRNPDAPTEASSKESTHINSFITILEIIIIILKKGINQFINLDTIKNNLLDLMHSNGC